MPTDNNQGSQSGNTRGGSHEEHVRAGEQSHKNAGGSSASGSGEHDTLAKIDAAQKAAEAKKGASSAESDAKRQAKQIDSVTTSLKTQLAALTESDREQAISNALVKAHVTAASADGQKVAALAGALYDAKAAQDNLNSAEHLFLDNAVDGLDAVLAGTESWNDALGNLLSTLGDAIIKAALLGEGPLAGIMGTSPAQSGGIGGILGSLFNMNANGGIASHGRRVPTFANGGVSNQASIFGEAGPEAAVPLPDGRRIPVDLRMPSAAAGSGAIHVSVPISINAAGADPAAVSRLQTAVAEMKAGLPATIVKTVRAAKYKQRTL